MPFTLPVLRGNLATSLVRIIDECIAERENHQEEFRQMLRVRRLSGGYLYCPGSRIRDLLVHGKQIA
jgi:hypothetical protein